MGFNGKQWAPAPVPLMTEWGENVTPENVWQEYPRPQQVRERWQNLNGLWDYAVQGKTKPVPTEWDGKILVPFCIESALSGVGRQVLPNERLWYRCTFEVSNDWKDDVLLLHFGAVDYDCTVWLNGGLVGHHRGGNTPFFFDITEYLVDGSQELIVSVWDPINTGDQPRGKQYLEPHHIWYTPVTGIWQTVWLEPVAKQNSIEELRITPYVDDNFAEIEVIGRVPSRTHRDLVNVSVFDGEECISTVTGDVDDTLLVSLNHPKLWSLDSPHLYGLTVTLFSENREIDSLRSYFAMRKISMEPHDEGMRILLNNEPLFQYGTLDQGWWPDGLLTPPSEDALRFDVDFLKAAGFNMIRKHIKIEPQAFYAHCDRIGMLVWQDMPSGFVQDGSVECNTSHMTQYITRGKSRDAMMRSRTAIAFDAELREMIAALYNCPSIVVWVPLNEGWGQHETRHKTRLISSLDSTRLINSTSGWEDRNCGDMYDVHSYEEELLIPEPLKDRATVLGEFGGLGSPVNGHLWRDRDWSCQQHVNQNELMNQYRKQLLQIQAGIHKKYLQAAVYTQTTDVEGEVNGLMTYDRKVAKMNAESLCELHSLIFDFQKSIAHEFPEKHTAVIEDTRL